MGIVGVLALAAGWMIWRDRSTPGPTTTLLASPTTTTSVAITTTTAAATTTTSEDDRVAEVEQILTDLWFGWFDAIYRRDPDALWDVVATTSTHESGVRAMTSLEFVQAPSPENISITIDDVLLDRPDCLVVVNTVSVDFIRGTPSDTAVEVLWPDPNSMWRFATSWVHPDDLWQADCDEVVRETTP